MKCDYKSITLQNKKQVSDFRYVTELQTMTLDPNTATALECYTMLASAVAPRPIAFVSTIDSDGNSNLAPYSFFNAVAAAPPTVIFSTSVRLRDNTTKDTYSNILNLKECVINMVSHNIVNQMAITSVNFPSGVSEFEKGGFTPLASERVKPFRVAESPVQMECVVEQIIPIGGEKVSAHVVFCRVVLMHIDDAILDANKMIDPQKIDLVGRLGRAWYTRASGESLFEIERNERTLVIGYDNLPTAIRSSRVFTGNEIAQLASLVEAPTDLEIATIKKDKRIQKATVMGDAQRNLQLLAQQAIQKNDLDFAKRVSWLSVEY